MSLDAGDNTVRYYLTVLAKGRKEVLSFARGISGLTEEIEL